MVVGAGPNGLTAAARLARAGWAVQVVEAHDEVGGGSRTAALTLPGFVHDVCAAVHPLGAASPAFAALDLERHGLAWLQPEVLLAHPLSDGSAVTVRRSLAATTSGLGSDGPAYRRLVGPLVSSWPALARSLLAPLLRVPRHPLTLAGFGTRSVWPARALARALFRGEPARALFAGVAAHSLLPLDHPLTAGFAVTLAAAGHAVGWPFVRGGSQAIVDALAADLRDHGGEIVTGLEVSSLGQLPPSRTVLLDVAPRALAAIAADRLPDDYRPRLGRHRHGPGSCKVDFALDGPVPWRAEACTRAGTVHVGGTLDEITASEAAVWRGEHHERPFVLVTQPSVVDASRAPDGQHALWAYCHVPAGSTRDVSAAIEAQIERFAPGFRERILAKHVTTAAGLEAYNPNYVGGDIAGGAQDGLRSIIRPFASRDPYATPTTGLFLCSSSTPPGAGVHGMCGWNAAASVLRRVSRD